MSDDNTQNKTKKCPKYYRRDPKTGECEYQDKKSFKVNSEGMLEIPEEFRDMIIAEKGRDYFKNNYETITDKEKKKGRIQGIVFTSEKKRKTRKNSPNLNQESIPIILKNTPENKQAAKAELSPITLRREPSYEIDILTDGRPREYMVSPSKEKLPPKKIRIKKSKNTVEIKQSDIMDALRDGNETNDAYVIKMGNFDPAHSIEKPPEEAIPAKEPEPFVEIQKEDAEKIPDDSELDYDFLYPSLDDPKFNVKLAKHKEFFDTKYDGSIHDVKTQADKLCNIEFELNPNQIFVKNFLSVNTPYNSLLLYAGLGTGKTCSAIGVAEEMRTYMKQVGMRKQILIIASPNVQDNFKLQLFDESRLVYENGMWKMNTCIGKKLLEEINPTNMDIPKERIVSQVKSIIKNYYYFMGYTQFANYINDSIELKGVNYSHEEKLKIKIKKIKNIFNNRLIIVDEVHNIRITHENKNRKTAELLMEVAKYADNMRLLLMSATPMYNSYAEIVWLTNLMNLNDKRGTVKISDIFLKDGEFREGGRDLLVKKITGYVSHVRGENPYSFPYRIYPEENSFKNNSYPTIQMNGKPFDVLKKLQNIPVYLNKIGEHQQKGYQFIIENMRHKNKNELVHKEAFDILNNNVIEMDSFGYSVLQFPLEALNIVYPSDILYESTTKLENVEENQQIILNMVGSQGLSNVMKFKDKTENDKMVKHHYEYISDKHGRIFAQENLPKYSSKMAKICEIIRKSEGIILIYSQWIDSGLVPMALALEEMGFTRYGSESFTRPLLKTTVAEPIDSLTMQTKSTFISTTPEDTFHQAKYVMITGDPYYSPNNDADLKYLNQSKNKDGKFVKVVLISKAAAEGVDFKNIRQIHVMEPWFNMNRIEQIIGRGVRNLSHCQLPFEKRNVEIFLHATLLENQEESSDLYVYRLAEQKSMKIGKVTRLLKETSVDCILNIAQTNFTTEKLVEMGKNQTVKIKTSSGREINHAIGDKPFSPICDYMDNCNYTCSPTEIINEENVIKTTYTDDFLHNNQDHIIKRIRDLFADSTDPHGKIMFQENKLIGKINSMKQYPIEQIYAALTYLIENKHEYIVDKYGRLGNLINKDKYYLFQPLEMTDEHASIYERSRPVDVKHSSIMVEMKEIEPSSAIKKSVEKSTEIQSFQTILEHFENQFHMAFDSQETTVSSSEKNWYRNVSAVYQHLVEKHQIPLDDLQKIVMDHMIDEIPLSDKIVILNSIYDQWKPINQVETYVKEYFNEKLVVTERGLVGFVLSEDNKTTQIYIQTSSNDWDKAEFTEANTLIRSKSYSEKMIVDKKLLNDTIGFMSWVENQQEYVFKIRDLKDSVNKKGARVNQALMKDIFIKINSILGEPYYNNENVKKYFGEGKNKLVVIIELIIRYYQDKLHDQKIWFLNNEQILVNGILNYTKKI